MMPCFWRRLAIAGRVFLRVFPGQLKVVFHQLIGIRCRITELIQKNEICYPQAATDKSFEISSMTVSLVLNNSIENS